MFGIKEKLIGYFLRAYLLSGISILLQAVTNKSGCYSVESKLTHSYKKGKMTKHCLIFLLLGTSFLGLKSTDIKAQITVNVGAQPN